MSGFVAESGWRHPGLGSALRKRVGKEYRGSQRMRKLTMVNSVELTK
jgi:hypothetical protein